MKKTVISRIAILTTSAAAGLGTLYYVQNTENVRYSMGHSETMENYGKVFEKDKTPVTNMVILLKVLNNSALCDDELAGDVLYDNQWYDEFDQCTAMLNAQIVNNENTQDEEVKEFLRLQQTVVNNMNTFRANKDKASIDELQDSYNKYNAYYKQRLQDKGGNQS